MVPVKQNKFIHQLIQRDVIQEVGNTVAQIAPQRVRQAAIATLAAFAALATRCINR